MPKTKPVDTEEKASDPTNPSGRPPDAASEVSMPNLLNELAHLLAQALARRWLEEHGQPVRDRDKKPGAS
jgi:hypothetical protein